MKSGRMLALLLSLVLLLSCGVQPALAADAAQEPGFVCTKETRMSSDGSSYVRETVYDKQGNPVRTVAVETDADGNRCEETDLCTYDENGNLTEETFTRKASDGYERHFTDSFVYDENGNVVENTYVFRDTEGDNGTLVYRYTYDAQNRLVREVCDDGDGSPEVWTVAFDEQDRVTEETYTNGTNSQTTVSTYNERGLPVKVVETDRSPEGSLTSVTRCEYDGSGNPVRQTDTAKGSDGYRYKAVEKTAYDKGGNVTKKTVSYASFPGAAGCESVAYTYDAKGRVTTETYRCIDLFETCKSKTAYTYNEQDQPTGITWRYFGTDGLIGKGKTTFTYDGNGDLTEKKETYRDLLRSAEASSVYGYYGAGRLKQEETAVSSDYRFFFGGYQSRTAETNNYDMDGNLLQHTYCNEDESGRFKTGDTYAYDAHGNMIENVVTVEDNDGVQQTVSSFEYQQIGA